MRTGRPRPPDSTDACGCAPPPPHSARPPRRPEARSRRRRGTLAPRRRTAYLSHDTWRILHLAHLLVGESGLLRRRMRQPSHGQFGVTERSEPIFNVPAAVIAVIVVCVLVH